MTTPPQPPQNPYGSSQPPQNPYGSPQQPQNPYAQQPQGQQPPYGYPQQAPPQQPYGFPQQQPYGPPQPGMPGAPGAPGMPGFQPPRKKRTGLIAAVVVGALVVAGGIAFGVSRLIDNSGVGGEFPKAEYKLTVPKTLLDGEYKLADDLSASQGKKIEDTYDPTVRNGKAVVAQYGSTKGGVVVISGMWGQFKKTGIMRDKMLKGAAGADGATVVVPPKDFTPAGYDITVSCQVLRSKNAGVSSTIPMCAWGDDNTGAAVAVITPETALKDPKSVDLAQEAANAAKIRSEARQPIG
ncbi:hypothetical protein PZB75_22350 [Streptomyces sp. AM 4-1-1]|uniref:hypothetical protein n=1 Tax=unclassified Streptomyces TaxID=2593676 RepID=UPI0023B92E13|nr:hypothetical protein [Streptomyces sp. AM 4-1-1]WEH35853.1 hypothetical protein PZB75_22350 [Streptomyces sp. AM 4-1-1]